VSAPAIWESTADFFDLHTYRLPADPNDPNQVMKEQMEDFGMIGMKEKPIIMGEFGAEYILGSSERGSSAFGLAIGVQQFDSMAGCYDLGLDPGRGSK
jgi:hypothetical protein